MKSTAAFILCLCIILPLSGSPGLAEGGINMEDNQLFMQHCVDSSIALDDILTAEYEINELMKVFMPSPFGSGVSTLLELSNPNQLRFEAVNSVFPVECIRQVFDNISNPFYYTVYQVKEGGRFFVIWDTSGEELIAREAIYIKERKSASEYDSIKIGSSTYKDVAAFDPATELVLIMSRGTLSFSALSDGTFMEIEYAVKLRGNDVMPLETDFVVKAKTICTDVPGLFSVILRIDLP